MDGRQLSRSMASEEMGKPIESARAKTKELTAVEWVNVETSESFSYLPSLNVATIFASL